MFSIISSYIRAVKYIIALVKFKEDKINLIDFKDEIYKGLDGKDVIVRVFYTNKKYAQSIIIFYNIITKHIKIIVPVIRKIFY